jgi:hypothetical protein
MGISRAQKLFGVGPLCVVISIVWLRLAVWVDHIMGHAAILADPAPMKVVGGVLAVMGLGLLFWTMRYADHAKLVGLRRALHNGPFQMVSSPDVRRLDYLYGSIHSPLFEFLDYPALRCGAPPGLAPACRPGGKNDV